MLEVPILRVLVYDAVRRLCSFHRVNSQHPDDVGIFQSPIHLGLATQFPSETNKSRIKFDVIPEQFTVKGHPALFEGEGWAKNWGAIYSSLQLAYTFKTRTKYYSSLYIWHTLSKYKKLRKLALCAFFSNIGMRPLVTRGMRRRRRRMGWIEGRGEWWETHIPGTFVRVPVEFLCHDLEIISFGKNLVHKTVRESNHIAQEHL